MRSNRSFLPQDHGQAAVSRLCKENLRNNDEFRCTVEKIIIAEEKCKKGSWIETTETTRIGKVIETMGIKTESVDVTTP
jgi:hypothetical protein